MLALLLAAMISTPVQVGITVTDSCAISAPHNPEAAPILQCGETAQKPLVTVTADPNSRGVYLAIVNF